ncbi:SDR family NAD(P)-dependent oxidoreductase [Williamsia sp. Leaf354]|uniref:SDR family NAD(P)-dependent oxidoreductase n=1 Tax=Williamsia sp. Leaf354 TaxID=1736349 RepID=UPI000A532243|nr:SDR family oxidoreductase [Williamsia sp. Leaf354]
MTPMPHPFRSTRRSSQPPPRALITGASAGIGEGFARALAARGSDLVLVARRAERLRDLADELVTTHGIACDVVPFDLTAENVGEALRTTVEGRVDLLINNAGFATQGPFVDTDPREYRREIAVDVLAVVELSRAFLPAMIARGQGGIINVSSTTAFQPVPSMAVYSASKAFVLSFGQSLWYEARQHGVTAFTLAPGPTRTEFFDVIGDSATVVGSFQTPDQVVATGLRALDRRWTPPHVVSGRRNAVAAHLAGLAPRRILLPVLDRVMHPTTSTDHGGDRVHP